MPTRPCFISDFLLGEPEETEEEERDGLKAGMVHSRLVPVPGLQDLWALLIDLAFYLPGSKLG